MILWDSSLKHIQCVSMDLYENTDYTWKEIALLARPNCMCIHNFLPVHAAMDLFS
eukprot:m.22981 g.22981  ORF g.22981 m.22981 type:complete len:55 (+) comp12853_c1_seq1:1-165(+)